MRKRAKIRGTICYVLGIIGCVFVAGYLLLICPIHELVNAFIDDVLTFSILIKCIVKIALSTTVGGFVWCLGYAGYNYFQGTEDIDWDEIIARRTKKKNFKENNKVE